MLDPGPDPDAGLDAAVARATSTPLPKRSCATPPARSTWHSDSTDTTARGDLLCFPGPGGRATVMWDLWAQNEAIWGFADSPVAALLAWWRDAPKFPAPS